MKITKSTEGDYHPAFLSGKATGQWWIIAAAIILGGLIGLGLSALFRPTYEAKFEVITNINLASNPNANELLVDQSMMHVGELAFSQTILDQVIAAEKGEGIELDQAGLLRIFTIERKLTSTYLKVQWSDAKTAAQIANTWGGIFYAALQEGERQAVTASELAKTQSILEDCLSGAANSSTPPLCGLSKTDLQNQLNQTTSQLATAQSLSLGLYPGLSVDAYQNAVVPGAPVRSQRSWMVGAGAAIGFIFALVYTEITNSSKPKMIRE